MAVFGSSTEGRGRGRGREEGGERPQMCCVFRKHSPEEVADKACLLPGTLVAITTYNLRPGSRRGAHTRGVYSYRLISHLASVPVLNYYDFH